MVTSRQCVATAQGSIPRKGKTTPRVRFVLLPKSEVAPVRYPSGTPAGDPATTVNRQRPTGGLYKKNISSRDCTRWRAMSEPTLPLLPEGERLLAPQQPRAKQSPTPPMRYHLQTETELQPPTFSPALHNHNPPV